MSDGNRLLELIDTFFPREIIGSLLVVFSAENIISSVFAATIPPEYSALAWGVIFLVSAAFVGYWTSEDDEENFS